VGPQVISSLTPVLFHPEEGGAVCWCRARAGSALGLGTPSSVEAGYVQSGLEPGAEDRGPCSACFET
jgi:hypothetical protein